MNGDRMNVPYRASRAHAVQYELAALTKSREIAKLGTER